MENEIFKVASDEYFNIENNDIEFMTQELKYELEKGINEDTIIAFCLSLDEMKVSSLIIYQACRKCGATLIRCGLTDIHRQQLLLKEQKVNLVVTSRKSYKYISNKFQGCKWIILDDFENVLDREMNESDRLLTVYELFDVPTIAFFDNNRQIHILGCDVYENEAEGFFKSKSIIKSFKISGYKIPIINSKVKEDVTQSIAISFIELQLKNIIEELGDSDIDIEGNIEFSSLGSIELLVVLEDAFGIDINIEEIDISKFRNIHTMAKLLNRILEEKVNVRY